MEVKSSGKEVVIRLDEGEEVISSIVEAVLSEKIISGTIVSCVGALKSSRLILRKGLARTITHHLEVVGNGNISQYKGRPLVHLHLAVGGEVGTWVGHLLEGVVDVFCEVVILKNEVQMVREHDKSLEVKGVTVPYILKFGEKD